MLALRMRPKRLDALKKNASIVELELDPRLYFWPVIGLGLGLGYSNTVCSHVLLMLSHQSVFIVAKRTAGLF